MSARPSDRIKGILLRNGLHALSTTWRIEEEIPADCTAAIEGTEPVVIAFWHGAMLPVWYHFRELDAAALISTSRDGELLSGYLNHLGYRSIIRGSSSRGGGQALRDVVAELSHRSVMITPDGPRGPARVAKAGALIASARSGRRMLLVGCSPRRAFEARGWDRMRIPTPFTRILLRYCILNPPTTSETDHIEAGELERVSRTLTLLDSGRPDERTSEIGDVDCFDGLAAAVEAI